ncbi:hypothetical protein [Sphingobacterium wenxiniae]|uniref:Uncharacterized protein n=1 Tax=Sphingobacterium wenxiniae TaxID=683125 RepID=A0A1I6U9G0_9SPHI|nr:hypothetical protein [Sphingobacterium wenxiniae]SFS97907.1 hypothetical protein SAMN05660206_10860 [Sphingobacterium wenxiniae]
MVKTFEATFYVKEWSVRVDFSTGRESAVAHSCSIQVERQRKSLGLVGREKAWKLLSEAI